MVVFYLQDWNQGTVSETNTPARNCNNNTAVKCIRNFGKIIRDAIKRDWIKTDPFRNIKLRTDDVDNILKKLIF